MGKINILEQDIVSKIAAGEVIERPVSVVKELVENSIDAGSKNIVIEIEEGGKKSIKVIDDGEGMSADDVKLAFKRHATSKIKNVDDIFNIKTLGFRGEALTSIAAVSNLSLQTKTEGESVGTICKISGGEIKEFGEIATNKGCIVEVNNLFFNTPARLKFLGNATYESSRITDLISKLAIGNIGISFRLTMDGKEIFYSSGNGDYKELIAKIYGVNLAREAIQIEKDFDNGKIWGYISAPSFNRGNRSGETFFVNGRFVKDTSLSSCLERAYKTALPVKRFPIALVFINIDNSMVDVNVHPSKMEIKFRDQNQVHQALYYAVNDGLKRHVLIPKETFDWSRMKKEPRSTQGSQVNFETIMLPKSEYNTNNFSKIYDRRTDSETFIKETPVIKKEVHVDKTHEFTPVTEATDVSKKFEYKRILGQLFNTYIVVEGQNEFYLIDQHAAHERILYELFSKRYTRATETQVLVAPQVISLSPQEMMLIEYYGDDIIKLGFDYSVFGTDSILVRAVPYIFNKPVDPMALRDALDRINNNEYSGFPENERLIISMSCHSAIRAGDTLSQIEMEELIQQLVNTQGPYTCPHGRPTIISITINELEKMFKRT